MIPLLLAGLAAAGALGAFLARRWPRTAALDCGLALAATAAVGLLVPLGPSLAVGEASIRDGEALRALVVVVAVALAALLVIVALQAPESEVAIMAGVAVAAIAMAASISDPAVSLTLAASVGFIGLAGVAIAWRGAFAQLAVVPGATLAAVILAGALRDPGDAIAAASSGRAPAGPVLVAVLLAMALVARLGILPLHFFPLRLARGTSLAVVPIQSALLPGLFAIVAVAWIAGGPVAGSFADAPLGPALVTLGALTIVLAAPAMLVQDDLGALLMVHAIGDLGVVLVALGADVPTGGALAVWLAMVMLIRIAAAGAAVALSARIGSRSVRVSAGWIRVAPLALPGWILIAAAGLGWPGSVVFEARRSLLEDATPGLLGTVLVWASMATALGYVRLVVAGLRVPSRDLRTPVGRTARVTRWAAALIVLASACVPAAIGLGGTRLVSALASWQPFSPP